MPRSLALRTLRSTDWPAVQAVYAEGIATGNATFQTEVPSWDSWDAAHLAVPRLIAERPPTAEEAETGSAQELVTPTGAVGVGWAVLSPVSRRCVYAGVAEVSVYVAACARGRGVGRRLLAALIAASEAAGLWTLEAGVFPENAASLALHKGCGFRVVGTRERLGKLGDRWRDVVLLERRSATP